MNNATQFCKAVEARLGWLPPATRSPHMCYAPMARRVSEKIATDPELYTWYNLALALELLVQEKKPRNPLGVFAHVPRALEMARVVEDDVELGIREAIAYEVGRGDPAGWETRLSRAVGHYRAQALAEWRESVR